MIWLFILWFLALIAGLFGILVVLASGFVNFEKTQEKKKKVNKIHCIKKGKGTIKEIKEKPLRVLVSFETENKTYQFEEEIVVKTKYKTWKNIPISKEYRYPFDIETGKVLNIKYNPKDPSMAYIEDNR